MDDNEYYAGYNDQHYEEAQYEEERRSQEYATYLRSFMEDFEPSDQLTVEIESQSTQNYMLRVT